MDASLQFAAQGLKAWGSDISKIRKVVVAEIWELKEEMAEQIDDWKSNLAPEVEQVSTNAYYACRCTKPFSTNSAIPTQAILHRTAQLVFRSLEKLRGV